MKWTTEVGWCRDKAPFMLIVEVLGADKDKTATAVADESQEESSPEGEAMPPAQERLESHASAGPGKCFRTSAKSISVSNLLR